MNLQQLFKERHRQKGSLVSIVIPIFNEEESLPRVVAELYSVLENASTPYRFEISFIDDRSTDNSFQILEQLSLQSPQSIRVSVLQLSKNSGSHVAVTAGLSVARGDFVIIMAGDGQDPASIVLQLLKEWEAGYEVVSAARKLNLGQGYIAQSISKCAWKIMIWCTKINIPVNGCDCMGVDRSVLHAFNQMDERNTTFIFRIFYLGFRQKQIEYIKRDRIAGNSKWSLASKISLLSDAVTGYSNRPLRLITKLGIGLSVLLGLRWLYIFFSFYILKQSASDLTIILNTVLTSFGIIVLLLGMIGDYIWRILDETRKRPLYEFSRVEGKIFE